MQVKGKQTTITATEAADKQLHDVASLYEKQFLREMVKQMRSSVTESELMPASFGEKYYREQLDHQYVESWGQKGGIGLGQMIYDQLLERYGERLGIRVPKEKTQGPLPLTIKDQWQGRIQSTNRSIQFQKTSVPEAPGDGSSPPHSPNDSKVHSDRKDSSEVKSPWKGRWLGSYLLPSGLRVIKIQHEEVVSTFVGDFQWNANKEKPLGSPLAAGETFAEMRPQSREFYWKLDQQREQSPDKGSEKGLERGIESVPSNGIDSKVTVSKMTDQGIE